MQMKPNCLLITQIRIKLLSPNATIKQYIFTPSQRPVIVEPDTPRHPYTSVNLFSLNVTLIE